MWIFISCVDPLQKNRHAEETRFDLYTYLKKNLVSTSKKRVQGLDGEEGQTGEGLGVLELAYIASDSDEEMYCPIPLHNSFELCRGDGGASY